ncbi:AsmA protein [Pseudomonas duriflava]|uniref:AsmA protein n=1 Tax=Pseudomonas duriflava TaxID=459528 RepID=A0A562QKN2_9PSED|nr:AsmA family protein [Pseudomonas duriflava]TWI56606.1 AsmA protein [Pseudomonas duriflava]
MKAFGKVLGLILLGLLLILVALGFALSHLFDPNDYKDEIRELARDKANIELTLKGDIGWSLFPWLGLELHEATIASLDTPQQPVANVQRLVFSVRVLPLLRRDVEMSDIRVDGLDLTLARDETGKGNWENVGKPVNAQTKAPVADTSSSPQESSRAPVKLDIDSLTVRNSRLDYTDARSGEHYAFEEFGLTTGSIREGTSIPLTLTGTLTSNQPPIKASLALTGNMRFDMALQRFQLENASLSGEAAGEPLAGKLLSYSAEGQILVDRAAQIAEWNSLKLSFNQLKALGELKVRDLENEPKLEGGLSMAQTDLRDFLTGIGVTLPEMADANTLKHVEFNTRLAGTRNSLVLEDLNLVLDGSHLSGRVAIEDFTRQALRIDLKGDQFDLDRYLPAKAATAQQASNEARKQEVSTAEAVASQGNSALPKAPTEHAWSDAPFLPVERLRTLDLKATLALNRFTVTRLPIDNASLALNSTDGQLTLSELRGDLFGGRFQANGSLDVRSATPHIVFSERIAHVPVDKILEAQGQEPPLRGALDLDADLTARGNSQKAWMDSLDGTARFRISNGVLANANLESQLCQGIALLNREALSQVYSGQDTPFREFSGSLTIVDGVASNRDLIARIPGLTAKGNGAIDLRVLGLDYRVGILLEGDNSDMPDPACQINERYAGIEWPLHCRGPLELGAKACRLDREGMTQIVSRLAGSRINDKIDEKLGDKISPELKDAIKGLFNKQ